MSKARLEAFSDGVLAILITIMVLELKVPQGADLDALRPVASTLLTYVLSFIYIGIYWNNHHHMLQMTGRINGAILWANLHLLFWLSLVPFTTGWMGEHCFAPVPVAIYGVVLFCAGVAYLILQNAIIAEQGQGSILKAAVGRDLKGKASAAAYVAAVALSFIAPWASGVLYVGVALMWLVPDRRIESRLAGSAGS
jgi:uncharacterized membrane protein